MAADFQAALETATDNFDFHALLLKEEKPVVTHETKKQQEAAVFQASDHLEGFKENLTTLLTQIQKVCGTFGKKSYKVLKGLIAFKAFKDSLENMTKRSSSQFGNAEHYGLPNRSNTGHQRSTFCHRWTHTHDKNKR